MRLSKATLAAAIALALGSMSAPMVLAMGVTSAVAKSSLYEPLRAEVRIALGPQDDYSPGSIRIASPEQFASHGLAYPNFAGSIIATLDHSGRGHEAVLRLRSARPIYEPVVRLLIVTRVGANGTAYLPVTIMLDSAFDKPLGDAGFQASLPVSKGKDARASKLAAAPRPASKTSVASAAHKPGAKPAAASLPARTGPIVALPKPPKFVVSASGSLGDRVAALEQGQSSLRVDMGEVKQKLQDVGDSLQALRDLAAKVSPAPAAKPVETIKPADSAKPAETIKPATVGKSPEAVRPVAAVKPVDAVKSAETTHSPETAKPVDAAKPAETVKPVDAAKPVETVKPADLAQPSDAAAASASASATAAATTAAEPAPSTLPPPPPTAVVVAPVVKPATAIHPAAPIAPAPAASSSVLDMWPYGLAALAALGAAGFAFTRKKKSTVEHMSSDEHDTDLPQPFPEEIADPTVVAAHGSTHFGPAHPTPESNAANAATIDDLHDHIFSSHAAESLVSAINLQDKDDKTPKHGFGPLTHLEEKAHAEAEASTIHHMAMPLDLPSLTPAAQEKPAPTHPHDFDAGMSFEDDVLDLSDMSFDHPEVSTPVAEPASLHAPAHVPTIVTPASLPVEEPLSMDFSSFTIDEPREAPAQAKPVVDPFTQAMNMARSTEARSSGDLDKSFNIGPDVEDGPGRLQLELACLYAQGLEWENARSTLKEILSDEEMAAVHPEARRLLTKLP